MKGKATSRRAKTFLLMLIAAAVFWSMFLVNATASQQPIQLTIPQAEKLFVEKVRPVIETQCQRCHSGAAPISGLDLSSRQSLLKGGTRGAGLLPGDAAKSLLFKSISGADERLAPRMPPNTQLPTEVIEAFKKWINAGAPWPDVASGKAASEEKWSYNAEEFWAFRPVQPGAIPTVGIEPRQVQTPVDAFILQKLSEKGLQPAPAADRISLIRRATFDLHGLPPTPGEVEHFVTDPLPTAKAFEKVVDRLLSSPRYGERWGRHWLDVVRYADTGGGSNDYERPHAWRYRDYVIRAFNSDKPYDQFILEQVAGDELDPNNSEHLVATGFLRMGPWEQTSMSVEAVTRQEWLDDVTHNAVTALLGLTMGCAKCHNHKFDPIPTKDYYRLQAVFATTWFKDAPAPFLPVEDIRWVESDKAHLQLKLARAETKHEQVAATLGMKPNFGPFQPGQTDALDSTQPPQSKPQNELTKEGMDFARAEARELERAYSTRVEFNRLALKRFEPVAFSVSSTDPGAGKPNAPPKPPEETFILIAGNLNSRGEKVVPGVLSALSRPEKSVVHGESAQNAEPIPATIAGRRLALAKWIADSGNPLTARVIVNRIWQWHFGRGLVETSNNFGKLGKRPSHLELLDWLARYFVESGWQVKTMHRLLMNSAVYQRTAGLPPGSEAEPVVKADPENRLLAHFPARRMEAEELRDSILAISGELNLEMGGPGTFPELNTELVGQPRLVMGTVAPAWEPSPRRSERNRRTIYTFQQRSLANPLVEVFNGANPTESCEFRRTSTIAPQVFNLFNSQFSADAALAFAVRLETSTKAPRDQIDLAFRLAYQRRPMASETQQALAHLNAMVSHHQELLPTPPPELKPVVQSINSEFTGRPIHFVEDMDFRDYERNLHPSQVSAQTRALAELCLVLFNSNEFLYIY